MEWERKKTAHHFYIWNKEHTIKKLNEKKTKKPLEVELSFNGSHRSWSTTGTTVLELKKNEYTEKKRKIWWVKNTHSFIFSSIWKDNGLNARMAHETHWLSL